MLLRRRTGRYPAYRTADAIQRALNRLQTRLEHLHERSGSIDERGWAQYVSDLDHGLDELDVEIGRAAQRQGPGPTVEEVLLTHSTALELQGWRLRFDVPGLSTGEVATGRSLAATAGAELDRYRTACENGATVSPDALNRSMDDLRSSVPQGG